VAAVVADYALPRHAIGGYLTPGRRRCLAELRVLIDEALTTAAGVQGLPQEAVYLASAAYLADLLEAAS